MKITCLPKKKFKTIDELKKINGLKDVAIDKGYNLNLNVHVDEKI